MYVSCKQALQDASAVSVVLVLSLISFIYCSFVRAKPIFSYVVEIRQKNREIHSYLFIVKYFFSCWHFVRFVS